MKAFARSLRPRPALALAFVAALSAPAGAADLATTAILQPVSGCSLGASANVTVRLFNYGPALPAATSFNVSYSINGGPPVTEFVVLAGTLLSDSSIDYTFATPADLATPGTYAFAATVALPGDTSPANDSLTGYLVASDAPSSGGTLSGPTGSSGTLTVAGITGDVVQWEESDDGGLRWFALANATSSQEFAGLRTPTAFRVRVVNGSCPEAMSNTVTVTP